MLTEQLTANQTSSLHAYNGGYFRMLVSPEQTGGSFSLIDLVMPRGSEPPRHLHTREDETFYVLEGNILFEIGDSLLSAREGQAVFAPRNVEHKFSIQTEQARMLTLLTPGDFANYFLEFSEPITQVPATLQAPQGPPPADILALWLTRLSGGFGVEFV